MNRYLQATLLIWVIKYQQRGDKRNLSQFPPRHISDLPVGFSWFGELLHKRRTKGEKGERDVNLTDDPVEAWFRVRKGRFERTQPG